MTLHDLTQAYHRAQDAAHRPSATEANRRALAEAERAWQAARAADWDRRMVRR